MRMIGLLFCPICVYLWLFQLSCLHTEKAYQKYFLLYYTKNFPGQSVTGLRRTRVPSNQLLPPVKPTVPNTPMKRICKWHFFGGVVPKAWSVTTLTSWLFSLNHLRIKSSKKFKPFWTLHARLCLHLLSPGNFCSTVVFTTVLWETYFPDQHVGKFWHMQSSKLCHSENSLEWAYRFSKLELPHAHHRDLETIGQRIIPWCGSSTWAMM